MSIGSINEAATLKPCWDLMSSHSQWSNFLKVRFIKNRAPTSYYISSSLLNLNCRQLKRVLLGF